MVYTIFKDGIEENRIVADEEFCKRYYSSNGYSYKEEPAPEPGPDEINLLRAAKREEIGAACTAAIYAGVDVGGSHYSLTEHDQMELTAQYTLVKEGAPAVPYHADGELCRMYPEDEFTALARAATAHVFYHRTYCNHVNAWIARAEAEELDGIIYGAELPEDLAASMAAILEAGGGADNAV